MDARARLEQQVERLEAMVQEQRATTTGGDRDNPALSPPERQRADDATVLYDRDREQAVGEGVERELAETRDALARLDAGTYGRCEVCGAPIGEERLETRPAARYCLEHQQDAEAARSPLQPEAPPSSPGGER